MGGKAFIQPIHLAAAFLYRPRPRAHRSYVSGMGCGFPAESPFQLCNGLTQLLLGGTAICQAQKTRAISPGSAKDQDPGVVSCRGFQHHLTSDGSLVDRLLDVVRGVQEVRLPRLSGACLDAASSES
jgi:hypothetical protein